MLTTRKVPRACRSCRLQLQSLFENGFTNSTTTNVLRMPYSTRATHHRARTLQPPRHHVRVRRFSTTRTRPEDAEQHLPDDIGASTRETEDVVRRARRTFGDTLPKDYLTTEEYTLYERLYGAPLRETRPEDLEFLPDLDEVTGQPVRNYILRENAEGEFEEVEFNPEDGFSFVNEMAGDAPRISEGELEAQLFGEAERGVEKMSPEELEQYTLDESFMKDAAFAAQMSKGEITGEAEQKDAAGGLVIAEPEPEDSETPPMKARSRREAEVMARLQQDMEASLASAKLAEAAEQEEELDEELEESIEEEEVEEEEEEDEDEEDDYLTGEAIRAHPHTMTGRFGASPSTIALPREQLLLPISELLERTHIKHVADAAEVAFGGKGLPHSPSIASAKRLLPQKEVALDASQHKMSEIEADAYLAAVMPATYASVMSTLVEVRKRLGSEWIRGMLFREGGEGPRVLDVGAGGAGAIAFRELVQAEWDVLKDDGIVEGDQAPHGKTSVVTGSNTLRHRVSRFLEDTTFLPRLPEFVRSASRAPKPQLDGGSAQPRKVYDIVLAPHTLFPLKEEFRRKSMVQNLWSLLDPKGGVLIVIEKGLPRGFEAVAGARSLLLDSHIHSPGDTLLENEIRSPESEVSRFIEKEEGMIIAPCTNHGKCPMYPVPGLSTGRKDFCHFPQRYIRPPFLQKILGATKKNHEDLKYSYLAVRRGVDDRKASNNLQGEEATKQALEGYEEHDLPEPEENVEPSDVTFSPYSLPRLILPALKRRGHVTIDLCTPSATLERWTVPRSFSLAAYRDARKSKWGDLWALGAKTRVPRSARLGRGGSEALNKHGKLKGIRDGKQGKGGKKAKKQKFHILMGKDGMEGIEQSRMQTRFVKRDEKRTKGGRIWKQPKPIDEDDL